MLEDVTKLHSERRVVLAELEQAVEDLQGAAARLRATGAYHTAEEIDQSQAWAEKAASTLRDLLSLG